MIKVDGFTNIALDIRPLPVAQAGTSVTKAAQLLLEDFGHSIGLPDLQFGPDNGCWLELAGKHTICIAAHSESEVVRLHGDVGHLLPESEAPDLGPYFRNLLERNADATFGASLAFAIDPDRNALIVIDNLTTNATQQHLQDALLQLVANIDKLQAEPQNIKSLHNHEQVVNIELSDLNEALIKI